jgi:tRNA G18 (ribose-2'-O)-methylase SpoU
LGADFIFTVQERFPAQALPASLRADARAAAITKADVALGQRTDVMRSERHLPYLRFDSVESLQSTAGLACLIGIELAPRAKPLASITHPSRALYLLGAEDDGLPDDVLAMCDRVVRLPGERSLNVSVAGSIVVYDRVSRAGKVR